MLHKHINCKLKCTKYFETVETPLQQNNIYFSSNFKIKEQIIILINNIRPI